MITQYFGYDFIKVSIIVQLSDVAHGPLVNIEEVIKT